LSVHLTFRHRAPRPN